MSDPLETLWTFAICLATLFAAAYVANSRAAALESIVELLTIGVIWMAAVAVVHGTLHGWASVSRMFLFRPLWPAGWIAAPGYAFLMAAFIVLLRVVRSRHNSE